MYLRVKTVIELAEKLSYNVIMPENNNRSEIYQVEPDNSDWPLCPDTKVFEGDFENLENFLAGSAFILMELQKMNVAMPDQIKIARRDSKLLDALQHSEEKIADRRGWDNSDDIPF